MLALRAEFGAEGYGIFFMLIEIMHNENGYIKIDSGIVFDVRESEAGLTERVVKACLKLGLFMENKKGVYSPRVLRNIETRKILREAGRRGGKKGKRKGKNKPPSSPPQATPQANRQDKTGQDKIRQDINECNSLTPAQEARMFFSDEIIQQKVIDYLSNQGAERENARAEIDKFVSWWTEKNKSGTKQRWEIEKTFEVKRRLKTWLDRSKQFKPFSGQVKRVLFAG